MSVHSQLQRCANDVRAAAGGHDFFAGRKKRWTHCRRIFTAAAAAVALLKVANERAIFKCKREYRLEWKFERTREVFAQVIINLVLAIGENLSRIENVFGIERMFDSAHHFEQLIAELFAHVFGAGDADAVLGRERTFKLPH